MSPVACVVVCVSFNEMWHQLQAPVGRTARRLQFRPSAGGWQQRAEWCSLFDEGKKSQSRDDGGPAQLTLSLLQQRRLTASLSASLRASETVWRRPGPAVPAVFEGLITGAPWQVSPLWPSTHRPESFGQSPFRPLLPLFQHVHLYSFNTVM